ncbi:MAG: hypothetical protein RLZZ297_1235 [Chloroflexota bacterium]
MTEYTRIVSWEDPAPYREQMRSLSGAEYVAAVRRGDIPMSPMLKLLDIHGHEAQSGRALFTVTPQAFHQNPMGIAHGGLACALLDTAMAVAVISMLPPGVGYVTLELKVNFTKPMTLDCGELRAEGQALYVGSRTGTAEGRIYDATGALYAHGTTTLLLMRPD